jgi:hypothetical protein
MKLAHVSFILVLAFSLAAVANATTYINYSWEDNGTIVGMYPDPLLPSIFASNEASWTGNPVYGGNFSLKLVDNAESGTPQAFLCYLWNLQDGDEITVGFWRYDDTPGAAPSVRLWGHWNDDLPLDINGYNGSAGGNSEYGPGEGWDYTSHVYEVVDGHTGLVIEARTYSSAGDTVWLDDLYVAFPDHVLIQIPGCSPVATENTSFGNLKALFR